MAFGIAQALPDTANAQMALVICPNWQSGACHCPTQPPPHLSFRFSLTPPTGQTQAQWLTTQATAALQQIAATVAAQSAAATTAQQAQTAASSLIGQTL